MSRIYVASSWRNDYQPTVVRALRVDGHEVYDFKNPDNDMGAFKWDKMDQQYKLWTPATYRHAILNSPIAAGGFTSDSRAMHWADVCVMVLPCGPSAHTEFGVMRGWGKRSIILLSEERFEPDLMYLFADHLCINLREVLDILKEPK